MPVNFYFSDLPRIQGLRNARKKEKQDEFRHSVMQCVCMFLGVLTGNIHAKTDAVYVVKMNGIKSFFYYDYII